MAAGGFRKGAGRKPRGKNKATIERELNVAAVIDRARREGRELAVDVMQRMMVFAEGATALHRPVSKKDIAKAADVGQALQENPDADWIRFGEWFDRWFHCTKELSKYQSPQVKSVDIPTAAPTITSEETTKFTLAIFDDAKRERLQVIQGGKKA